MICPVCKKDTLVLEYKQIELDYCQICKGAWFDAGELELLLEKGGLKGATSFLTHVINHPEAMTSEKKHRCPICGKNMRKIKVGEESGIMVDACGNGHGIWLDGGEATSLAKIIIDKHDVKKEEESAVIEFLRDVFPG